MILSAWICLFFTLKLSPMSQIALLKRCRTTLHVTEKHVDDFTSAITRYNQQREPKKAGRGHLQNILFTSSLQTRDSEQKVLSSYSPKAIFLFHLSIHPASLLEIAGVCWSLKWRQAPPWTRCHFITRSNKQDSYTDLICKFVTWTWSFCCYYSHIGPEDWHTIKCSQSSAQTHEDNKCISFKRTCT